jgi:hypothetical protein
MRRADINPSGRMKKNLLSACSYRQAIRSTLIQQLVILGLTSMILDGGVICCMCFYAALGFWTGVLLIRIRRPIPTKVDLAVIEGGYLPCCLIAFFFAVISHSIE